MIKTVQALAALHGSNFAIVVNHSGGKDSQRMLGFIRDNFPEVKTYVVMADTGFEHVRPITAEDFARQSAERFGLPLHVVRNPNKTYLQMVERRGKFPSSANRQCTSDLKRGPIEKFIRHLNEKVIVNCTGIRAAESPARKCFASVMTSRRASSGTPAVGSGRAQPLRCSGSVFRQPLDRQPMRPPGKRGAAGLGLPFFRLLKLQVSANSPPRSSLPSHQPRR